MKGREDCSFSSLFSPLQCSKFPIGPPRKRPLIWWQSYLALLPKQQKDGCLSTVNLRKPVFVDVLSGSCTWCQSSDTVKERQAGEIRGCVYNGSSLAYVEHFQSSPFHTDHPVILATGTDLFQKKSMHISALEDSPWLLDFEGAILQIKCSWESADIAQSVKCLSFTKLWVWPPALHKVRCVWFDKARWCRASSILYSCLGHSSFN